MYQKVLIPLDGSKESEGVFPVVRRHLEPDTKLILLRVIRPGQTIVVGDIALLGSQIEEDKRFSAMSYLRGVTTRINLYPGQCQCEVVVDASVSRGIVRIARRDEVDLVAIYTHDRRGLARLIKKSIARDVERKSPIDVWVVTPAELELVA